MSFIGNVPAEAYSPVAKDTFSGDDSTTDFTLSIPATTNGVEVLVENVQQEPTTAYTISGTTLSFTAAPVTGTNNIYVIHRGPAVQTVVPPAGVALNPSTVDATGDISTDGDVNTDTINEKTSASGVTIDGVLLKDNDVTATDGSFSGDMKFNSGYGSVATAYGCRAWVNFRGHSAVFIRASGNVSSITDQGTGDYTVNYSSAMPDTNYSLGFMIKSRSTQSDQSLARCFNVKYNTPLSTTSTRVVSVTSSVGLEDGDQMTIQVFR